MKTFRNKHFTKRNYDCTNVVFCQSLYNPDINNWVECTESEIATRQCYQLYIIAGVRYFGWL